MFCVIFQGGILIIISTQDVNYLPFLFLFLILSFGCTQLIKKYANVTAELPKEENVTPKRETPEREYVTEEVEEISVPIEYDQPPPFPDEVVQPAPEIVEAMPPSLPE